MLLISTASGPYYKRLVTKPEGLKFMTTVYKAVEMLHDKRTNFHFGYEM